MDRIESIRHSSVPYIENELIEDFDEYFSDVIGVTIPRKKKVECVKLKFSEFRYPYIVSKPLHETMKYVDKQNRIVSIDVIPNKELIALLLSFGPDVEVLEPPTLREELSKKILDCYKKYFVVQNGCTIG